MKDLLRFLSIFELSFPYYFWVGSAILFLVFFPNKAKKVRSFRIDLKYWMNKIQSKNKKKGIFLFLIIIISFLMLILLVDPHLISRQTFFIQGKPVMLVVDISGSMSFISKEEEISNYERAKEVVDYIISRGIGVNFGILFYSTDNYIARYFAYKNELLKDTMENWEEINHISAGTKTGSALENLRTSLFQKIEVRDKAVIILSDLIEDVTGEGLAHVEEEMIKLRKMGVYIYVIVMEEEEQEGEIIKPDIEGVKYVSYYDKRGIDTILQEIVRMDSSPLWQEELLTRKKLTPFLIIIVQLLLLVCIILSETTFRKIS